MSNTVDNAFITKFETEVNHQFQRKESLLRNTVRTVTGVGSTYRFPLMDSVSAVRNKARHADITPANINHDNVTVTLTDVVVGEYIDDFDAFKTNVDLRNSYTEVLVAAMSRELDALIIEALNASTNSAIGVSNTLNKAGLIKLGKALDENDVPEGDRFAAISTGAKEDILSDTTLTSKDYIEQNMLSKGMVENVMGFNLIHHTGLPADTAGKRDNFFYHKSAVGLAIGQEMKVDVDWVPVKRAHLIALSMSAGATIIRPEGVQWAVIDD